MDPHESVSIDYLEALIMYLKFMGVTMEEIGRALEGLLDEPPLP